jgi:hypothetical protein
MMGAEHANGRKGYFTLNPRILWVDARPTGTRATSGAATCQILKNGPTLESAESGTGLFCLDRKAKT